MAERFIMRGTKLTYDCSNDKWVREPVDLSVEREPFQEGGMRLAYRARERFPDGGEIDVVLKCFKEDVLQGQDEGELIKSEAMTQMVAEDFAQQFNKLCSSKGLPHRLAFVPVSVAQIPDLETFQDETYSVEPFLPGDYKKYNDNNGHNEIESDVVGAFCYFTYHQTGGALVVTDIQGVGTFYTDPQIHTLDGTGFGAGNLGEDGINRFLRTHQHTLLCEQLGLPSPNAGLSDAELAAKLQAAEAEIAREDEGRISDFMSASRSKSPKRAARSPARRRTPAAVAESVPTVAPEAHLHPPSKQPNHLSDDDTRPKLVLPQQYSARILRISFLTLASIGSSIYHGQWINTCLSSLVFFTSVNYWRNPTFGWRRNFDIVCAVGALSYQGIATAYQTKYPGARHIYWAAVSAGLAFYAMAFYSGRVLKNLNYSSALHCGVHICGNIGNLILYDSLGKNCLGFT